MKPRPKPRPKPKTAPLKECPFCGFDVVRTIFYDLELPDRPREDTTCAVTCDGCKATGPIARTELAARRAWNVRRG